MVVTTTEAGTEMAAADVETGTEEIPQTDAPEDIAEDSVTAFVNRLYNVCLERVSQHQRLLEPVIGKKNRNQ